MSSSFSFGVQKADTKIVRSDRQGNVSEINTLSCQTLNPASLNVSGNSTITGNLTVTGTSTQGVVSAGALTCSSLNDTGIATIQGNSSQQGTHLRFLKLVTPALTADPNPLLASNMANALILVDSTAGNFNLTLPTATNILAAFTGAIVGSSFEFSVRNTAGANAVTVLTNTGLTLSGTMTIGTVASRRFIALVTNVGTPAITIYSMGTNAF